MTSDGSTIPADVGERRRLRIGVITAFPPSRNSLNEFGYHMVKHLSRLEEVAEVIVYSDRTDAGDPVPIDKVTFVPSWRFNAAGNLASLPRAIARTKPDAVVLNLQFATFGDRRVPGALGLLIPAVLRARRTPTLLILHNLADNVDMQDAGFAGSAVTAKLMTFAGRVLTRALLRADLVALTIPRYVEFLRASYGAKNAILAPHGSFEDLAVPSFTVPPGRRSIMAFGKWGTYKTVDMLVAAYQELLRRGYDDIRLVLAGTDSPNSSGYMASAQARFADVPHLEFPGYIAESEVGPLFLASSVVAFPYTSTTGSSGVLHQAGEYGRAVVLPRIGDLVDIIEEEGFRGVYFEPGDAVSLADAIAEVLDDPDTQTALGRRNFAAATGIPMSEVVQWHVAHIDRLLERQARR
ncbi:glycosyltransferase [Microbacterium sp. SSW1-49]|uniref:D-inositol 3-phosphate glycosyltransferase n=1 Tax=Microbacterium croceum TaxID=2851645 RepID=A0ABT0FHL1_9MICO|nr:glycosyltransferase [Microbacterium croceum]MCK2037533.1 glycosyltransferase [Microbacterium croceum]